MQLRRRKRTPFRPPVPRLDTTHDPAEQRLFDEAFAEPLWRRATPR